MKKYYKNILLIYLISTLFFLLGSNSSDNHSPFNDNLPKIISVYITETNTVTFIPLETYVTQVVASEMPSSFHIEALKAQAVAARTYAVAKIQSDQSPEQHPLAPLCDTTHCQVYSISRDIPDKIKKLSMRQLQNYFTITAK